MKVTKQREHGFLVKPFGTGGKLYLACTILLYVDLKDATGLLTEQELWKTLPDQLGETPVLDVGMPKPRGEVLATGACWAPRGTTRPASEVSITVGGLTKTLNVFGDRHWTPSRVISDPEPFEAVPITWENAFGGPGFDANPVGKGVAPARLADDRDAVPLPNIEDPGRLIGAPSDRPSRPGSVLWT